MTTRSSILGAHTSSGTRDVVDLFTCPAATTALFKSLVVWGSPTPGVVQLVYVRHLRFATSVVIFYEELTGNLPRHLDWWLVLESGDTIVAALPTPGVVVGAYGTLLPVPG